MYHAQAGSIKGLSRSKDSELLWEPGKKSIVLEDMHKVIKSFLCSFGMYYRW